MKKIFLTTIILLGLVCPSFAMISDDSLDGLQIIADLDRSSYLPLQKQAKMSGEHITIMDRYISQFTRGDIVEWKLSKDESYNSDAAELKKGAYLLHAANHRLVFTPPKTFLLNEAEDVNFVVKYVDPTSNKDVWEYYFSVTIPQNADKKSQHNATLQKLLQISFLTNNNRIESTIYDKNRK